jgi:hypothetical protein
MRHTRIQIKKHFVGIPEGKRPIMKQRRVGRIISKYRS